MFFIVLDLRLTKIGTQRSPFFLPVPQQGCFRQFSVFFYTLFYIPFGSTVRQFYRAIDEAKGFHLRMFFWINGCPPIWYKVDLLDTRS